MICWQPYTPIYAASTFCKNSYIKILISLYPCLISYNLSQGALCRSKYFSGVFSINFPHSDSLLSVFIDSKLPAFSFNSKIFSFSRILLCSFLICATGKIEIANPISYLNQWLMLGVRLDEFIYLFIYLCKYKATWLLIMYWNSNAFTKIIMSTKCNDKNKKFFFELRLYYKIQFIKQTHSSINIF